MKTLKICLLILCLLPFRAVGFPQSQGAKFFMAEIIVKSKVYGDKTVLIDDEYEELVSKFKWYVYKGRGDNFYAQTNNWKNGENHGFQMHRLIMNFPKGLVVDHKNGNGLDNRKENLRLATHQQNTHNSKPYGKLKLKGITFISDPKRNQKYLVRININGKSIRIGRFYTLEEAIVAYNKAAIKFHGEFAWLNPLPE